MFVGSNPCALCVKRVFVCVLFLSASGETRAQRWSANPSRFMFEQRSAVPCGYERGLVPNGYVGMQMGDRCYARASLEPEAFLGASGGSRALGRHIANTGLLSGGSIQRREYDSLDDVQQFQRP